MSKVFFITLPPFLLGTTALLLAVAYFLEMPGYVLLSFFTFVFYLALRLVLIIRLDFKRK